MEPIEKKHVVVRGRVVDRDHNAVGGALVAIGAQTKESAADGSFAFDLDDVRNGGVHERNSEGVLVPKFKNDAIIAVKTGHLPARADLPPLDELRKLAETNEYTLVLGGAPLEIRGRVVDADDKSIGEAILELMDETPFGMIYEVTGREGFGMAMSAEQLLRGGYRAKKLQCDAEGAFVIGDLLEREYRLAVLDPRTLRRAISDPIRAGTRDALIRLPTEADCVRVAGRVVAKDGTPIAGAELYIGAAVDAKRQPMFARPIETDAKGRFEFARIAAEGLSIHVSHPSIFMVMGWRPGPKDKLDDLTIEAVRRCHVQVDLGDRKDRAASFVVLDSKGERVELVEIHGSVWGFPEAADIVDGKSEPIGCGEAGTTVVLYKDGKEVERVPVTLKPGELVIVRP
jgi:hypothetical protein